MTPQEIITIGQQIAAETTEGGNTAERVGGVIEGIGQALQAALEEIDGMPHTGDDALSPTSQNFAKNCAIYQALQAMHAAITVETTGSLESLKTTLEAEIQAMSTQLSQQLEQLVPSLQTLKTQLTQLGIDLTALKTQMQTATHNAEVTNQLMQTAEYARQQQWTQTMADIQEAVDTALLATKKLIEVKDPNYGAVLEPNKMYEFSGTALAVAVNLSDPVVGELNEWQFSFNSGATPTTLDIVNTIKWTSPVTIEANKHYEVNIVYNQSTLSYYGIIAGWDFTAPAISSEE